MNTGCVRYGDVRSSPCPGAIAGETPPARDATEKSGAFPPFIAAKRSSTSAGVVVSSNDNATRVASSLRMFIPRARHASTAASAPFGHPSDTVSKNGSVGGVNPSFFAPAAKMDASACVLSAMFFNPSGPW